MNRTWLEMVFPLALSVLVVTIGMLLLSMTGVTYQEPSAGEQSTYAGTVVVQDSLAEEADLILPPGIDAATIATGGALFQGNCAQCHAINDVVVGPALAEVTDRRPEKWLLAWVKNSGKLIANGDDEAVKIFNQYQQQQMPSFQLSDDEIRAILAYVNSQSLRESRIFVCQ